MQLSRYFRDLRAAYDAEINDLLSDSEGKNVLDKRLREKRSQIEWLVMMMDDSPEMLAPAFHRAFGFPAPGALEAVLACEPAKFPAWAVLRRGLTLAPWAEPLAATVLQQPGGDRFLVATACLEYLHQRPDPRAAQDADDRDDEDEDDGDDRDDEPDADDNVADSDEAGTRPSPRQQEDAGADWMEEHGFDRKP
jgi:hypothetical protein